MRGGDTMTRISVNKIANSKIDGYNVRAYALEYSCFYGMDFVDIPEWRYVLLVYKNKFNFRDVMVEIREMDDAGNINQISPELIKSILPSRMKDNNYYELNGVAYLRNSVDGWHNSISHTITINMDVVCQSCGYRFISNYGKHLQIMKRWHNVIHTYDEAEEVYNLLKNIKEFKYQITETGSVNVEIKQKEESIANILNEISKCDIERREMYIDYENGLNFIGSFGIDTKPFEIVE